MKTLFTRILSAVVAVALMTLLYTTFQDQGLQFLCFLGSLLGLRELQRILFHKTDSRLLRVIFAFCVLAVFAITTFFAEFATLSFAVVSIFFCSVSILFEKKFEDLKALSLFQAKSLLGFFYVGMIPGLAAQMLNLPHGRYWFFTSLILILSGDTFAYITGMLFGNKKILPAISPKKTVAGSIGGLFASITTAVVCGQVWFPEIPVLAIGVLAGLAGAAAQIGDLFESMLKRVANIKDSGSIMPGHGGMLDRIDGVLFGLPVVYLGALIIEKLF